MRAQGWSFLMGVGVTTAVVGLVGLGGHSAGYRWMVEPAPAVCAPCEAAPECSTTDEDDDDEDEANTVAEEPIVCPEPGGHVSAADRAHAQKALEQGNHAVLLGDFHLALAKGYVALEIDPYLVDAHKLLGVAYARVQSYCPAKTEYRTYLACNPTSTQADRIRAILQAPELKDCP